MKTKKFDRKLFLNKITISHLTDDQMNDAAGGTGSMVSAETCVWASCDCDQTRFIPVCRSETYVCGCPL